MQNEPRKSLTLANRFSFTCPIFGADVELRGCFHLRNQWARGQTFVAPSAEAPEGGWTNGAPLIRKGCQACMASSKCPVIAIIQEVDNVEGADRHYFSAEPKKGSLTARTMKSIAPIVVPVTTLNSYGDMPARQRELITGCNGLGGFASLKGTGGATLEDVGVTVREDKPKFSRGAKPVSAPAAAETPEAPIEVGTYADVVNKMTGDAA